MNVVILWHMHQPYYVNPLTKKAKMPWVRLHAAKGYLDMIDLVTARPEVRVNFNFTPVLVRQMLSRLTRGVLTRRYFRSIEIPLSRQRRGRAAGSNHAG